MNHSYTKKYLNEFFVLSLNRKQLSSFYRILFSCFIFLLPFSGNSQTTIHLGSGGTHNSAYIPIYSFYGYNYSQVIYTADEMHVQGMDTPTLITKIWYLPKNDVSTINWKDWKIYMGNTSKTGFSTIDTWIETSSMTKVFDGEIASQTIANQWLAITLSNPFEWDGSSNIVVAVNETTPSYGSSIDWAAYTLNGQNPNEKKGIYFYSDYEFPDPHSPPSSFSSTNTIPQIQFTGITTQECDGIPMAGVIEASEDSVCMNSYLKINNNGTTIATNIERKWQSSLDNGVTWSDIPGSDNLIIFEPEDGLTQNTMFRHFVKCLTTNQESFSNEILVTIKGLSSCYCELNENINCDYIEFNSLSFNGLIDTGITCGYSYADQTSNQNIIPSLSQGANYSFSADVKGIDYVSDGIAYVYLGAWVDFNQNGVFDTTEFFYFGEGYEETLTGTILIPLNAIPGNTKMRVKSRSYDWFFSEGACEELERGMVRDYTVNIVAVSDCAGQPSAGVISGSSTVCLSSKFELEISGQTIAHDMQHTWEMSQDGGLTWTVVADTNVGLTYINEDGITQASQFRHKVKCLNSGLEDYSNIIHIGISDFLNCYCVPEDLDCEEKYSITKVSVMGLVDTGLTCFPYYEDRSSLQNLIPQLMIDASGILLIEAPEGFNPHIAVWIDFNQDGVFDYNESVYFGLTTMSNIAVNLEVPFDALVGQTKMRVISSHSFIYDACPEWNVGAVKDYLVEIIPSVACTGSITAGIASGPQLICSGSVFSLFVNGTTYATGLESIWQISQDSGQTWNDIVGSDYNLSYEMVSDIAEASHFRFIVTCPNTGLSDTSNTVYVDVKPFNECYCLPIADYYSGNSWIESVSTTGALQNISNLNSGAPINGYSDYTSTHIVEAEVGNSFNFEIKVKNAYSAGLIIWIDWNQNGVFETNEQEYLASYGSYNSYTTYTGVINVPSTAASGMTRMRVKNYYGYSSSDPCSEAYASEAEDYGFNVLLPVPCAGAPNPGLLSIDSQYCYSSFNLEVSGFDKGFDLSGVMQQSTDSGATWTNLQYAGNDSVYYTSISVPTWFRFLNSCASSGLDSASNIIEVEKNHMNCYCIPPSGPYYNSNRINSVSTSGGIINISNLNTGLSPNSYEDYSGTHMLEVNWDQTFNFVIQTYTSLVSGIKVWIDWNQNGVFDNDELVYTTTSGSYGYNTYTDSIHVPLAAIPGDTKMRIRNLLTDTSSCNYSTYGETEDYLVRVNAIPDCSGLPQLGLASAIDSICPDKSFNLDVQGVGIDFGLEGVWQMSNDNGQTWTDIVNSQNEYNIEITSGITQSTDYRFALSCTNSGQINYSNVLTVNVIDYNNCYCTPTYTYGGYYLKQIQMNGIDSSSIHYSINTSPNSNGVFGYDYRVNDTLIQAQGLEVDFSTIFTSGHTLKIWIDSDKNGMFNELDELVFNNYSSTTTQINAFLVPYNLPIGTYRMRVAAATNNNNFLSCGSINYGSTVDFTLKVISAPSCLPVIQLNAENVMATTADVSWTNVHNTANQQFEVEYGLKGFSPGTGTTQYTDSTFVVLNNLPPNKELEFYVRKICGNGDTSAYSNSFAFATKQIPASLPYIEDFSNNDFTFVNGAYLNQWSYGSATGNPANSLYISNDGGINNTYSINSTSLVYAYRDIEIPANADTISLEFDWKGYGDACCDYMRLWLMPDTVTPIEGVSINATGNNAILVGKFFDNQTSWETYRNPLLDVSQFSGKVMRMVFEWRNNASVGTQSPIAIDNIKIIKPSCYEPSQLAVSNIMKNTADLSWISNNSGNLFEIEYGVPGFTPGNGMIVYSTTNYVQLTNLIDNTEYITYIREICGPGDTSLAVISPVFRTLQIPAVLPYFDDFTSNQFTILNNDYVNRWEHGNATGNVAPSLYISNDGGLSNSYSTNTSSTVHAFRDIEVPQGATFASLSFDWKGYGEGNYDYLRVWLTPINFIPNGTITSSSDRIRIGVYFSNSSVWKTQSIPLLNISMFEGQTVRLIFEWRNDNNGGSQPPAAIDNVNFMIPSCAIPDHFTSSNITHESVTLSWHANNIGDQFELQYGQEGFNLGSGTSIFVSDTLHLLTNLSYLTKYEVYVRQICAASDSSDWVGPVQFKTSCPPYFTTPFIEDFNNGSLPDCWTIQSDGGMSAAANWRFSSGVDYGAIQNGRPVGTYAWVDASSPYQNVHEVILTSPFVNISQLSTTSIEFEWYKNHFNSQQQYDDNKLSVEIRGQLGWTEVWSANTNSPEWRSVFIPLDGVVGDSIQVRFIVDKDVNGNGYFYDDLLIDNVQIKEANYCFGQPSTVGASVSVDSICENATIELSLYSNLLGIEYQWQKSTEGLNNWVDINGADSNVHHLINGIVENTDFRLIATCISSGLSDTSSVLNVKTIKKVLLFNKSIVQFGDVVIDDTVIQTVVIQNTCVTPMQILSATAGLDMTVILSNSIIAPGQSIVAQIIFNPQNGLIYSDSFRVVTNNRTYAIPITGKGVNPAPNWTLTPFNFNYGNIIVNQDSVHSFTIKNTGNVAIELGSITSNNPAFQVISAPQSLAKLANGVIKISFQPSAVSTYNGTIVIESNTSNLSPLMLNLNGMGYIPSSSPVISYNSNYPFSGNSGVDKQVGIPGTYTYSLVYSHPDNIPPMSGYPQVGIDYNGDQDFIDNNEGLYTLSKVGNGTDWINGEIFEFTTVLPLGSTFGYQFFAKDELGNDAISQIVNYHSAPLVTNQSLDLSIYANDITFSDNNPDVNQNFQVFANINNNSPYSASNVPISFYMDSVLIGRDTIPFIAANSNMSISRNLNFNADGFYPIKVWVDSSQTLNENNILNNYAIRPVIVGDFSLPGIIQTTVNRSTATCPYPRVSFNGYATYSGLNLVGNPPALGTTVTLHILGDTTLTTNTVTNGYWNINWSQLNGGMLCGATYDYELVVTDYTLTSITYTGSFTTPCYSCSQPGGPTIASSSGGIGGSSCTPVSNHFPYQVKLKNQCNGINYFNDTTKVYVDNSLIATFTSANLLPCDSIIYNGSYLFSNSGIHTLKFVSKHYDSLGNPRELVESKSIKVEGLSDLMITNFQKVNSTAFKFSNRNGANCVPAGHHWVHVYDSTASTGQYELIASYEFSGLSSNSSATLTYSNPNFEMGYHYLRIVTDVFDEVAEYNEANNILEVEFYVPYPELVMSDITMSNSNITPGSLVNFTAKVKNTGGSAEPFHVQFYDGNQPIGNPIFVNGLASNASTIIVSPVYTVSSEECPIWIRAMADVNNVNIELNKENNIDTLAVAYDFISGEKGCNVWGSSCKPYIVIKDTENQFFSSVKNIGTRDAFDIVKVRFEVDNQIVGYDNIAGGIPSLMKKETNVFHTFEDTGRYVIMIYPNYDSHYCELTDTNNVGKIHVKVIDSYPDLYLFSQHISPSNLNPNPGQSVNVVASVFNSGLVPSTPTTVRFWVDDVQLGLDVPLDVIGAGDDTTVAATLPYSSNLIGPKIIKVKADAEDLVVELNKLNNTATRSIIVGAAPDMASSIHEAITLSNESPRINEAVVVSNYIRNYGGDGGVGYIHFYVHDEDGNQALLTSEQFALGSGDSTKISFTWIPQALGQTMITSEIANVMPQEFNEFNNFDTLVFHVGRYLKINDVTISSNQVCENDSVQLAASVSSEGQPLTYEWTFNGAVLANSNSLNLMIPSAQASNAGLYAFRVTDEGNTKVSQSMQLTVNPPIQLIAQPDASLVLCEGKVIELNVDAQNVASYDWKHNGAVIGQYASSLFLQEALPSNSGNYYVELLGLPGCSNVTSQVSSVVVHSLDNALIDLDAVDSFEQKANVNYHYSDDDCKLLASVFNGNQDLGNTRVHTIVDTSLVGYVARYTDIHPENNNLPADVTLYFKQSEFDAYNAWAMTEGKPLLPQNPTDSLNIPNLTINQFHGLPSDGNTGPNQSYDATNYEYITNGITVNWDNNKQLWVVQFPVSSFSGFFVGTFKNNPFPIKLISIQATNRGAINTVEWKTASEGKGDYFELERSSDGKTFEKLSTITAKGKASTYFYDDLNPVLGNNYYRLKLYDASGIFAQYSKIVEAQVKEVNGITLTVYPNPTNDKVEVNIIGKISNSAYMTLTDINGRLLETIQVAEKKETIDLSSYAIGVYLIKYTDKNTTQTIKVVRE